MCYHAIDRVPNEIKSNISADALVGAGACAHAQLDALPYCMQVRMQSYMLVAIQCSQAAALCTQAEQYLQ